MIKVRGDFYFVPFDEYTELPLYNSSQEFIESVKNSETLYTLMSARLYKNKLVLDIWDHSVALDMEHNLRLPNYKLMETLYELPSNVTKRLVKWYIGYDAKDLEEVRIHLMAKVLSTI